MVAVAIGGSLGKLWWRRRWRLWLLCCWQVLWPPRGHGCSVDDSGWPWMTVVCAFLLAVDGVGKGERWWWWLRLQGWCWSDCDLLLWLRWRSWWQYYCQCGLWLLLRLRIGGRAWMHRLRRQGLLKVIRWWRVLVRGYEMKIVWCPAHQYTNKISCVQVHQMYSYNLTLTSLKS